MSRDQVQMAAKRQKTPQPGAVPQSLHDTERVLEEDETSSSGSSSSDSDDGLEEESLEEAAVRLDPGEDSDVLSSTNASETDPGEDLQPAYASSRMGHGDLKSQLETFLPQLRQANQELQDSDGVQDRRVDHVSEDEEHYIEMNLNLGVLEEKSSGDDDEIRLLPPKTGSDEGDFSDNGSTNSASIEDNVLSRLRGKQPSGQKKRTIEEVG